MYSVFLSFGSCFFTGAGLGCVFQTFNRALQLLQLSLFQNIVLLSSGLSEIIL